MIIEESSYVLVQKFLRFVDLGCEIRASTTIRVVQQHQLAVLLADLLLVQSPLAVLC
jgi:hypothetical protein